LCASFSPFYFSGIQCQKTKNGLLLLVLGFRGSWLGACLINEYKWEFLITGRLLLSFMNVRRRRA
jgi:hypothetical protein